MATPPRRTHRNLRVYASTHHCPWEDVAWLRTFRGFPDAVPEDATPLSVFLAWMYGSASMRRAVHMSLLARDDDHATAQGLALCKEWAAHVPLHIRRLARKTPTAYTWCRLSAEERFLFTTYVVHHMTLPAQQCVFNDFVCLFYRIGCSDGAKDAATELAPWSMLLCTLITRTEVDVTRSNHMVLRSAAKHGDRALMDLLLEHKAVDLARHGPEALHVALEHKQNDVVDQLLLDGRVDPGPANHHLLLSAIRCGNEGGVRRLLADGRVCPVANDHEALRLAVALDEGPIVALLLCTPRLVMTKELWQTLPFQAQSVAHAIASFLGVHGSGTVCTTCHQRITHGDTP